MWVSTRTAFNITKLHYSLFHRVRTFYHPTGTQPDSLTSRRYTTLALNRLNAIPRLETLQPPTLNASLNRDGAILTSCHLDGASCHLDGAGLKVATFATMLE